MGFSSRWIKWIKFNISTVKHSVLVNRRPVGFFLPQRDRDQVLHLNLTFLLFEALSGLHINMLKSVIYPVNEVHNLEELAGILGCNIGTLPTTWNVEGANNNRKNSTIKSLVCKWKVDVMCLQETKIEDWPAGEVYKLWENRWAELKASGNRGGIIVIWDRRHWNNIENMQGSFSISCILESTQEELRWCFTGCKGSMGGSLGAWRGDFNVCIFERERLNCTRRSRAMRVFSETIQDLCLIDSPLQGACYTWTRGENCIQASRIDRFLISPEWNESFKAVKQQILPRMISDQKPIMLESGDWDANPSYFKFKNIWLQSEGFMEKLKRWWQSYSFTGSADFILMQKLKTLKKDITTWNKEEFRKLETKRTRALTELLALEHEQERRNLT
ncbi:uncharacterized protein [Nicotiana sylvestris]|uniref:uncharacterized protein n=1 Tax=Nicotiana sylvestris TaxID=4096 RepID=UPI00388C9D3A